MSHAAVVEVPSVATRERAHLSVVQTELTNQMLATALAELTLLEPFKNLDVPQGLTKEANAALSSLKLHFVSDNVSIEQIRYQFKAAKRVGRDESIASFLRSAFEAKKNSRSRKR